MTTTHTATIIGGRGFIGQALHRHLAKLGWECHVPDRSAVWPQSGVRLGHIFYCAGLTADYQHRPADTAEAHVGLLSRVLQSSGYDSLVYLSSTRLYDGSDLTTPSDEEANFRLQPRQPRHLYDLTKLTGEALCHAMGNGRARVARLSCVYGAGPCAHGFLPEVVARLAAIPRGDTIALDSSPHVCRDYVYLNDVVQALVAIALRGRAPAYNVASGENVSNAAIARWVSEATGKQLVFRLSHSPAPPPLISVRRLAADLGWTPAPLRSRLVPWLEASSHEVAEH